MGMMIFHFGSMPEDDDLDSLIARLKLSTTIPFVEWVEDDCSMEDFAIGTVLQGGCYPTPLIACITAPKRSRRRYVGYPDLTILTSEEIADVISMN